MGAARGPIAGARDSAVAPLAERSGVARIAEAFARAHADGRAAALMPYMMGGYPDLETSREIGRAYVEGGADLVELGVPFSDPLADGPVIHAAATAALRAGVSTAAVLELAAELSASVPVILMCYINPILARGLERFCDELGAAGASGLIVPDLPLEEAPAAREACARAGLAFVPLVAPTSSEARVREIARAATGFLYAVSVTGTTGERGAAGGGVADVLAHARAAAGSRVPIALGFGISTPEQAADAAAAGADGVIVGSRLVRAAGEGSGAPGEIVALVRGFAAALTTA
jgi:tryptophan synthase alpha chain